MANVTLSMGVLENYASGVRAVSEQSSSVLADSLAAIDLTDRGLVEDLVMGACRAASQAGTDYATQFSRGLSLLQTGEDVNFEAMSTFDQRATLIAIRGIYKQATDEDGELDEGLLARELVRRVSFEANRATKVGVWERGQQDSRDVRYARVPAGAETCAWCLMTAGLGYWFMTEEAASHTHAHCVVGDTEVYGRGLLAGMRREYKGPLISLTTAKGRNLTVTPDHPILTTLGWKRAGDLVEGDDLICAPFGHGHGGGVPDVYDAPPTAKEVFEASSLVDAAALDGMPAAAKNLYREMFPDGDVKVVSPDGLLERALEAALGKPAEHERLSIAGELDTLPGLTLDGERPLGAFLGSGFATPGCVICRGSLSSSLLGGHGGSAEESSLGASTMLDAGVTNPAVNDIPAHTETVGDGVDALATLKGFERAGRWGEDLLAGLDACALQSPVDGGVTDAELLRNLGRSDAAPIEVDNLVSLSVSEGSCHVYNLSTRGGWYVSSGILTHNCDCVIVPSIGRGDVVIDGYDSTMYRDMWREANEALRYGDVPTELAQRVDFLAATRPGYRTDTNGALAVMRWKYGLK